MKKFNVRMITILCLGAMLSSCAHDPYLAANPHITPAPGQRHSRASDIAVPLLIGAAATALLVKSHKDRKKYRKKRYHDDRRHDRYDRRGRHDRYDRHGRYDRYDRRGRNDGYYRHGDHYHRDEFR